MEHMSLKHSQITCTGKNKSAYILKRVEAFDYAGNDVAPPAKNLNYPTK